MVQPEVVWNMLPPADRRKNMDFSSKAMLRGQQEEMIMNLIGHLKEQADKAESRDEARGLAEKAGMMLTDEELNRVSGGAGSNYIIYTVGKGDTLNKIAKQYRVSVDDIVRWNKIVNPRLLLVGQNLKIYPH